MKEIYNACMYIHICVCAYTSENTYITYTGLKTNFLPEVEDKILTIATCVSESAS